MKKEEFFYDSMDGLTKIHGIRWIPDVEIRAVLQISHGMAEFLDRYDGFAEYMAKKGILAVGNDHLGHGGSIRTMDDLGFFADRRGNDFVIGDMHTLMKMTKKQYPSVPYFLIGHSMGSFLTRIFITKYGGEINGAILSGTADQPDFMLWFGIIITRMIETAKGPRYRSPFINKLAFDSNNSRFMPSRTRADWLTTDGSIVEWYLANEKCGFIFTLSAYRDMFRQMLYIKKKKNLEQMPKSLPVIFLSGKDDPVGEFGKGVERAYRRFAGIGMKDISIRLYEGARHEILNETNKEIVYNGIYEWLEGHITRAQEDAGK